MAKVNRRKAINQRRFMKLMTKISYFNFVLKEFRKIKNSNCMENKTT